MTTKDIVGGFDPTGQLLISAADLLALVSNAGPEVDKGFVITTTDIGGVGQAPDAEAVPKWQRYIWRRISTTSITLYTWNPAYLGDYSHWQSITLASIPVGAVTNDKIAAGAVTDEKIASVSAGKITGLTGVVPGGAAGGALAGTYPNPGLANNSVGPAALSSDAGVSANRAVGTNHIQDGAVAYKHMANDAITKLAVPTGVVVPFAGEVVPAGWLECNGAAISADSYPALYALIGATLPDLRGEFVRGWDHSRGVDVGRAIRSTQVEMVGPHAHTVDAQVVNGQTGGSDAVDFYLNTAANDVQTNNNTGTENRPRNVALMYIIKT